MKKFGFTLSELLVAVAIVAVASALIAPTVADLAPDKNKMKVISYYNKINEINQKLLSDTELFQTKYKIDDEGKKVIEYYGLADFNPHRWSDQDLVNVYNWDGSSPVGSAKYPQLFMYAMTGSTPYYERALDNGDTITISCDYWDNNVLPNTTRFSIKIDADGLSKGKDCSYSSSCQQPDTFIFKVNEDGVVTPGDAMTDAYLANMSKSNSQKADKELAEKFLNDSTKPYNN